MYEVMSEALIRESTSSSGEFRELFENYFKGNKSQVYFQEILKNPFIKEALLIASPDLYYQIRNYPYSNEKKNAKIEHTLVNYFKRMQERTTPFGLFSSIGKIDDIKKVTKKMSTYEKKITLSSEWSLNVLKKLESLDEILLKEKVIWNPLYYKKRNFIEIKHIGGWKKESSEYSYFKMTETLYLVKESCQQFISLKQLITEKMLISENTPTHDNAVEFIKKLIDKELLITSLRPSVEELNSVDFLIEKLEGGKEYQNIYNKLIKIKNLMSTYETSALGDGENILLSIQDLMKDIHQSKKYYHIDLLSYDNGLQIHQNQVDIITEALNKYSIFVKRKYKSKFLQKYLEIFIEKYGIYRQVPLMELLNTTYGLGNPYNFKIESYVADETNMELLNAIHKSLQTHSDIDLSLLDVNYDDFDKSYYSNLEVYIKFLNNNKNQILISPNSGSNGIGKTSARFKEISSENLEESTSEIIDIEITEIFNNNMLNDLSSRKIDTQYEISTNSKKSKQNNLDFQDIVVTVEQANDNFYFVFKSRKLDKTINFISSNNINYKTSTTYSFVSRFLLEVSDENSINILDSTIMPIEIQKAPYVPSLVYKNVIIKPKRWLINSKTLDKTDLNIEIIKANFLKFIKCWSVPSKIIYIEGDRCLSFNLNSVNEMEKIVNLITKKQQIVLMDANDILPNIESNLHQKELVLFLKNKEFHNKIKYQSYSLNEDSKLQRVFIPGSKWVYLKIYAEKNELLEILTQDVMMMRQQLLINQNIINFHYLFYVDGKSHLRLRFEAGNEEQIITTINIITEWVTKLYNNKRISLVSFDSYERELERYGGDHYYLKAEKNFTYSSYACMDLLKESLLSKNISIHDLHIISLIDLMIGLGLEFDDMLIFINSKFESSRKFKKEYNKQKNNKTKEMIIGKIKNERSSKYERMFSSGTIKHSNVMIDNLISSLIHMHCNRLYIDDELMVMYFLKYYLKDIQYIMKKPNLICQS